MRRCHVADAAAPLIRHSYCLLHAMLADCCRFFSPLHVVTDISSLMPPSLRVILPFRFA